MADTTTLQGWLVEAEAARHKLATGAAVASIKYEGREITYSKADLPALDGYISWLKSELSTATGIAQDRRRPIHLSF